MEKPVGATLTIEYDVDGDILRLSATPPYAGQESDEFGDGVIVRSNPDFGHIESIEVFFFSSRFDREASGIRLPIGMEMWREEGDP